MALTKVLLSGSTGGKQISVAATATPGTLIHTTGTSATALDEVWLFATNTSTAAVALTVEWGGTTSPNDVVTLNIPAKSGDTLVRAGIPLAGDGAAGRTVRAFAATGGVVNVFGYVNRVA